MVHDSLNHFRFFFWCCVPGHAPAVRDQVPGDAPYARQRGTPGTPGPYLYPSPAGQVSPAHKKRKRNPSDRTLSLANLLALPDEELMEKLHGLSILDSSRAHCGSDVTGPHFQDSRKTTEGSWYWRRTDRATCNRRSSLDNSSSFDVACHCRVSIRSLATLLNGFPNNEKLAVISLDAALHEHTVARHHRHLRSILALWAEDSQSPIGGCPSGGR